MALLQRRPFFALLLTAAAFFVAANLFIAPRSHRMPYHVDLDNIEAPANPNLLILGNSLLLDVGTNQLDNAAAQAGLHAVTLNTALSGSEAPEQRLLFEYGLQRHPSLSILVVGFYDFQLTKTDHAGVGDLIFGRQVGIDPRLPLHEVAAAYRFGPLRTIELGIVRDVPLLAYRAGAWGRVARIRRALANLGIPGTAERDDEGLEAPTGNAFDQEAMAFVQHPGHFNSGFQAIFQQARAHGMQIVAVVMPMSPEHMSNFYSRPSWPQYLSAIQASTRVQGLPFHLIDASRWEPGKSSFVDNVHMTPAAAENFTWRLGSALARVLPPASSESAEHKRVNSPHPAHPLPALPLQVAQLWPARQQPHPSGPAAHTQSPVACAARPTWGPPQSPADSG